MIKILFVVIIYFIFGFIVNKIIQANTEKAKSSVLHILFWPVYTLFFVISAIVQLLTIPFGE